MAAAGAGCLQLKALHRPTFGQRRNLEHCSGDPHTTFLLAPVRQSRGRELAHACPSAMPRIPFESRDADSEFVLLAPASGDKRQIPVEAIRSFPTGLSMPAHAVSPNRQTLHPAFPASAGVQRV